MKKKPGLTQTHAKIFKDFCNPPFYAQGQVNLTAVEDCIKAL